MSVAQSPEEVLMVRPTNFGFNQQTAVTNHFQDKSSDGDDCAWSAAAVAEFDAAVAVLRAHSVPVTVFPDTVYHVRPDAVFPNNWLSVHQGGELVLYPMATANRRLERRQDIIQWLKDNFEITKLIDLTTYENENKFLEGTGSIVFDYSGKVAYACQSVRTNAEVLEDLCKQIGYEPFLLTATDKHGRPIYHTNVILSLTSRLAILCSEAVEAGQRSRLEARLVSGGRGLVRVSRQQVDCLAANCYEVRGRDGRMKLVISTRAWASLDSEQKSTVQSSADIALCSVDTIERVGGGGIRCMVAGIFAPRKQNYYE